jgi:hypothetical protein
LRNPEVEKNDELRSNLELRLVRIFDYVKKAKEALAMNHQWPDYSTGRKVYGGLPADAPFYRWVGDCKGWLTHALGQKNKHLAAFDAVYVHQESTPREKFPLLINVLVEARDAFSSLINQ